MGHKERESEGERVEGGDKERCGSRVPQIKSSWADSGQCPQNHNNITGSANLNCMCVNTSSCPHMKGKSFIRGAVSTHPLNHTSTDHKVNFLRGIRWSWRH